VKAPGKTNKRRAVTLTKGRISSFTEIVGGTEAEPQQGFLLPGRIINVDGNRAWFAVIGPDEGVIAEAAETLLSHGKTQERLGRAEGLIRKLYKALRKCVRGSR
jgi:hypothetical protein